MSRKRQAASSVAPRMFVCTATTVIAVHGTGPQGVSLVLTGGAQVNFDQVVGHGPDGPVSLEQALGPHVKFFAPATPAAAPVTVPVDEE